MKILRHSLCFILLLECNLNAIKYHTTTPCTNYLQKAKEKAVKNLTLSRSIQKKQSTIIH